MEKKSRAHDFCVGRISHAKFNAINRQEYTYFLFCLSCVNVQDEIRKTAEDE